MSNYFNKGFNAVYYPRVHCPICKERISASAQVCPWCKTDLMMPHLHAGKNWQKGAKGTIMFFSIIIGILVCTTDAPATLGIICGLIIYAIGYVIIQRIQSIKNYFHK